MAAPVPLLVVIAGSGRFQSMPINGIVSIGRDRQCTLAIDDPALSRHHCDVEATRDCVLLRDLGSRNGCFVNGRPVTKARLVDGDQISIGDSALLFLHPGSSIRPPLGACGARFDDTPLPEISTVAIAARDTRYSGPPSAGAATPETQRTTRDLSALLRFSESLQRVTTRDDLHGLLLTHALEAVPADAAAIVVSDETTGELRIAAMTPRENPPVTVNRTMALRAITERTALLANEVTADARFTGAASTQESAVHAALCVPLLTTNDAIGAVYVTSQADEARFSEDDLHVLAAIGSIGGLALDRVSHLEWLEGENTRLRSDGAIDHQMIGESEALHTVFRFIERVAPTDSTVLVRGESGTGKELIARAIHRSSPRARGPFVAINCAALPEALLESELFGHERGAFTGAIAQQRGRLELADGGTVFLDEIGEMPAALQAKLLRVLQDHVVERVGGRRSVPINVRVIAATNRDLEAAIAHGAFRPDLYYRLNVVSVVAPPLRQRRDDLPLLAVYFVRKHAARCKRSVKGISAEARRVLLRYDWPGNVRELENAIERAVVLGSTDVIHPDDLPEPLLERPDVSESGFHKQVAAHKRSMIREALEQNSGNVAQTARALGLQPTYLHRLIRQLDVKNES